MTDTNDPDVELVDRIFPLHPPINEDIGNLMSSFRGRFYELARDVVHQIPRSPERTLAIRKIHDASQSTITSIATNQHLLEDDG